MRRFDPSRRRFIGVATVLILAAGVVRFLSPRSSGRGRRLTVAMEKVPRDGALVFRRERVAIIRQGGGEPMALSLVCTHLGCTVSVGEGEMVCPCHGSRFDREGGVLSGPAASPLGRLPVVVGEGIVEVILES